MNKRRILGICLAALALSAAIFALRGRQSSSDPISITGFQFNTVIQITIYDSQEEALLDGAMALCRQYEDLFSATRESSELYQLNHRLLPEGENGYEVSSETAQLIQQGLHYSQLSGGAFDITIEPVSSLWDFTSEEHLLPDQAQIEEALPHVGYENVQVTGNQVRFSEEETAIDLGAIAKGYIADRLKEYLTENGVTSAIINLGGNTLCIGAHPDGTPFSVGIQKPFAEGGETTAVVEITGQSVVSSGIYERCFRQDGVLYHHLLDPRTGWPYDNGLLSVSIVSDDSVDGDGLSTTCFALGLTKGMELIESLPDVEACFITEDNELHYSSGFEGLLAASR